MFLPFILALAQAGEAAITVAATSPVDWTQAPREVARFESGGATYTVKCGLDSVRVCTAHDASGKQVTKSKSLEHGKGQLTIEFEQTADFTNTRRGTVILTGA